jgi:hypothetical protein
MRKIAGYAALVAFSLMSLGGCVTAKQKMLDAGINPMTDQEMQELFSQPGDASFSDARGRTAEIHYTPDGIQKMTYPGGYDEGTYSVADGQFCDKWKVVKDGAESCHTLFMTAANTYKLITKEGSDAGVLKFK